MCVSSGNWNAAEYMWMCFWYCVVDWVWSRLWHLWSSADDLWQWSAWSTIVRCRHCSPHFTESFMPWCQPRRVAFNKASTALCWTLQAAVGPRHCHGDSTEWCGSGCLCKKYAWSLCGKGEEIYALWTYTSTTWTVLYKIINTAMELCRWWLELLRVHRKTKPFLNKIMLKIVWLCYFVDTM